MEEGLVGKGVFDHPRGIGAFNQVPLDRAENGAQFPRAARWQVDPENARIVPPENESPPVGVADPEKSAEVFSQLGVTGAGVNEDSPVAAPALIDQEIQKAIALFEPHQIRGGAGKPGIEFACVEAAAVAFYEIEGGKNALVAGPVKNHP
jgi:hypothetical protein